MARPMLVLSILVVSWLIVPTAADAVPVTALDRCAADGDPSSQASDDEAEVGAVRRHTSGKAVNGPPPDWTFGRTSTPGTPPYERCTVTLRGGSGLDDPEKGARWWPFDPLPAQGGLEVTAARLHAADGVIRLSDVTIRNRRPTDARLAALHVEAVSDRGEVIATGTLRFASETRQSMVSGVVVGADGELEIPVSAELRLEVPTGDVPRSVDLEYRIESYDRFYRIASASEVDRYLAPSNEPGTATNEPRVDAVHLRRTSDTCLAASAPPSYAEAVQRFALPFMRPTQSDRTTPEDLYVVTMELARWPAWADQVKAGPVVGERPLVDDAGELVTTKAEAEQLVSAGVADVQDPPSVAISPGGGYELCAVGMQTRILEITALPAT